MSLHLDETFNLRIIKPNNYASCGGCSIHKQIKYVSPSLSAFLTCILLLVVFFREPLTQKASIVYIGDISIPEPSDDGIANWSYSRRAIDRLPALSHKLGKLS